MRVNTMRSEKAVSEIIGVILLVAIVFLGIGILLVYMNSGSIPQEKAKAVLSSSCLECDVTAAGGKETANYSIVIRHEGGDVINTGDMDFWLKTEFPSGIIYAPRIPVYPSKFYPADVYSGLSRADICNPLPGNDFRDDITMKNGDAIVATYRMENV